MRFFLGKILSCFIPVKSWRRKLRSRLIGNGLSDRKHLLAEQVDVRLGYKKLIVSLREKARNKDKIRVAFLVVYDSVFPARPLFEKMLLDDMFSPSIVIIPDVSRGQDNMILQLQKAYNTLARQYSNVFLPYDEKAKKFIDCSDQYDLVCFASPYDLMTHDFFTIKHWVAKKIALPFYLNYSYFTLVYTQKILVFEFFNYLWKAFLDSELNVAEFRKRTLVGSNDVGIMVGYCKMDNLVNLKPTLRERKRIIIAPHHTVRKWEGGLELSNFLSYCDLFQEIPRMYPGVDFVFRPHPLLFVNLRCDDLWGEEKTERYVSNLKSNPNCVYSDGGDYLDLFVNSDGIIHDCGSFILEYLFTENPSCYLLKGTNGEIDQTFTEDGKKCLEHCYKAFNRKDILGFIDNVIIEGYDPMKENRIKFVKEVLKINYPHATDMILNHIKKELGMFEIDSGDNKKTDIQYWENYYRAGNIDLEPSLFAKWVLGPHVKRGESMIELGCGSGRDAVWFAANGINVVAVDQCRNVERYIAERMNSNLVYKCADFTRLGRVGMFDHVYSRFTLHSITEADEDKVVRWAADSLKPNGKFLIEVRSTRNDLYAKGHPVSGEKDAFIYNEHYRRFLDRELFCERLRNEGFSIVFIAEDRGFAPHLNTNEIFMRIVAQRRPAGTMV